MSKRGPCTPEGIAAVTRNLPAPKTALKKSDDAMGFIEFLIYRRGFASWLLFLDLAD